MESSSEYDNFVWTDASNSTSSEDNMMTKTTGGNSGGEDSEYDKSYKKKLYKELLINQNGHEREGKNKKRKRERYTSGSEHSDTPKKKIKVEPESDLDVTRLEDKHTILNGYEARLLDQKVKKEQEFLLPSNVVKKKKRKRSTSCETDDIHDKLETNESNTEDLSSRISPEASDTHQYDVTKNKKKKKKLKRQKSPYVEEDNHNTVEQQTDKSNGSRKKDGQKDNHSVDVSRELSTDSTTPDVDISEISKISNVNMTQDESLVTAQNDISRRKLSERIQFEDDVINSEPSPDLRTRILSGKLKRFAEKHSTLRECTVRELTGFTIGAGDEVWVVTCPSDVDVAAFAGRTLELGGRCKVKLQGAAYEGAAAAAGASGAALLAARAVRRVPLAGRLALRRRQARAPPDPAPAPAAPAAPLPLPATRLRHPLLGAHYKKALKLPPAVRERLRAPSPAPAPAQRRPKSEAPPDAAPAPKKKSKKKKHDLEAPETWESERAIEESLFDF